MWFRETTSSLVRIRNWCWKSCAQGCTHRVHNDRSQMNYEATPPSFSFDLFYTTVNAYYRTAAVKAAIELGIFDVVGERGKTIAQIASEKECSERGVRILCRFLVFIGFLKQRDDVFFMTREMAMFL